MRTFLWPSEGGWPYPDTGPDVADPGAEIDDDLLSVVAGSAHLLDCLSPLERRVIAAHYGLDGHQACSMKQLHNDTGMSRAELRDTLGSGLHKLRARLSD